MPSFPINNLTAPDAYTAASTLQNLPPLDHVNIDVVNAGIYWSIQQADLTLGTSHTGAWQPEVFMAPGSRSLYRRGIVGIRVRAAIAAASLPAGQNQAQVTVEAVQA